MKYPRENPLKNKCTEEVFLLISRGMKNTGELAEKIGIKRSGIYDNIKRLRQLRIIEPLPNHKGFIVNEKIAEKYINLLKMEKEIEFDRIKEEIIELKKKYMGFLLF